jgi:hypothetical protein
MKLPAQGREKNRYLKQPYYIQSEILSSLPKERIPLFHHILAECVEEIGDNESRLIIKDDDAADGFEVFWTFCTPKMNRRNELCSTRPGVEIVCRDLPNTLVQHFSKNTWLALLFPSPPKLPARKGTTRQ